MIEHLKQANEDEYLPGNIHFIRRIYFLRDTGEAIAFFHKSGDYSDTTVEQDWEQFGELRKYADRKEEVDVLEWTLPDPAVEEICMNAAWLGVEKDDDTYRVIDASPEYDETFEVENA